LITKLTKTEILSSNAKLTSGNEKYGEFACCKITTIGHDLLPGAKVYNNVITRIFVH